MSDVAEFLKGMIGGSPIEWVAVVLGFINVALLIRRSIWNYPFGMVMVLLYGWIFLGAKLYGQSVLQAIYFSVQLYGLLHWLGRRDDAGRVIVRRLNGYQIAGVLFGIAFGAVLFGVLMSQFTDAVAPYADGSVAAIFLAAQILLATRYLENWLLWIIGDIFAVGLYWSQGLQPTAALYLVFMGLSTLGFIEWRRAAYSKGP